MFILNVLNRRKAHPDSNVFVKKATELTTLTVFGTMTVRMDRLLVVLTKFVTILLEWELTVTARKVMFRNFQNIIF